MPTAEEMLRDAHWEFGDVLAGVSEIETDRFESANEGRRPAESKAPTATDRRIWFNGREVLQ